MAQIAGIVLALAGAYEKRRGANKAERAQNEAVELQKHYDKQAVRTLGDEKIYGTSEWLFPGLLAPPIRGPHGSVFGEGKGISTHKSADSIRDPWGYLQGKGMGSGGGVSTPTGPTAPLHGGIDPTTLQDDGAAPSGTVSPIDQPSGAAATTPATHPPVGGDYRGATPQYDPATAGGKDLELGHKVLRDPISRGIMDTAGGIFGGDKRAKQEATRLEEAHHHNVIKKKKRLGLGKFGRRQDERAAGEGPLGGTEAGDYPGQLIMQHLTDLLKNPGQLSSTTYERDQEQANQGLNAAVAQSTGQLTGLGIDPRSGLGQVSMENAVLNFGKERNEAARDYSLAQEELKRQDIQAGIEDYLSFINQVMGIQQARAEVKGKRKAGQKAKGTENAVGGDILQNAGHAMMGGGGGAGLMGGK